MPAPLSPAPGPAPAGKIHPAGGTSGVGGLWTPPRRATGSAGHPEAERNPRGQRARGGRADRHRRLTDWMALRPRREGAPEDDLGFDRGQVEVADVVHDRVVRPGLLL